jgi:hypothetical protein
MAFFQRWSNQNGTAVYFDSAAGTTFYPSDARTKVYQGTTTTGKPPSGKPMPPNDYDLNIQDYSLYANWNYSYPGPPSKVITVRGPCLPYNGRQGWSWVDLNPRLDAAWSDCYNQALDKLVDDYRGNLDISIDLAESRQTIKMFKVTDQVLDFTSTFVRRFGVVKVLSNAWLQYTYGVKPLLSTIHGLADENLRVIINKVNRYKARRSMQIPGGPINLQLFNGGGHPNFTTTGTGKASVTIGTFLCSPEVDPGRLSSLNPASIAWELMPYSFVVDWFYNLGGYLRNMETALLYDSQFRGGYVTKLWAYDGSVVWRDSGSNFYSSWTNSVTGHLKNTTIIRRKLHSFPRPELPSFGAKLGSSRLISASALLGQMLGRR